MTLSDFQFEVRPDDIVIDPESFVYTSVPERSSHLFIVEKVDDVLRLHIEPTPDHYRIPIKHRIHEDHVVGGGNACVVHRGGTEYALFLGGVSGRYYAIPRAAAQKFGELLKPMTEQTGMTIGAVEVNAKDELLNEFWKNVTL